MTSTSSEGYSRRHVRRDRRGVADTHAVADDEDVGEDRGRGQVRARLAHGEPRCAGASALRDALQFTRTVTRYIVEGKRVFLAQSGNGPRIPNNSGSFWRSPETVGSKSS